jgi:4-hydroxybenzoate polyprenyltransferase
MIALLLATVAEARPLLERLAAVKRAGGACETYEFPAQGRRPAGVVVISGMGPPQAAAASRYAVEDCGATRVVNLGICGALDQAAEPGLLYRIAEVAAGDAPPETGALPMLRLDAPGPWARLPSARLVSVGTPVFGGDARARLASHAELVDMEGFAVAETCLRLQVPCQLIKGVTDRADAAGREALQRNLPRLAAALADQAIAGLDALAQPRESLGARMARFIKVEHTIFSLPLLFAGAWLGANGHWPGWQRLGLVVVAGLGARTLGMAMNRILDRHLDRLNPRTAGRELPSGRLTTAQAWAVAASGLALYLLACAALGPVCLRLSPIPAAVLVTYSLLKRFTCLCHYGIGVCLALGPLGAFVAVSGHTAASEAVLLLALFTLCWMSGFDIIYSLQDLESDRQTGVHSLPVALGSRGAQAVAALTHLAAVLAAVRLWWLSGAAAAGGLALGVTILAFGAAYLPTLPLPVRFFPVSAIAGIAGALIPLFGGLR